MPWNLARPLPLNLMPWCCFIALRIVCAHPALQGSFEGHDLAPAIHSSHEHFLAPYNDHHGFKHGEFVNHKRLRENQQVPHQSEFLNADTQSPDLRDNLGLEPESDTRLTHVAKRPMTVQDGHLAAPILQSLNHGLDTSSPFGPATYDGSGLSGLDDHLAGHQFNHLLNSLFPFASPATLHPHIFTSEPMLPVMPPHEAGKPWDDLINVPGLHNELLYSEFGTITDSTWLSSFGQKAPFEQSTVQNLPTPELAFQSISSRGFESPDGDHSMPQLSMQFGHFGDSLWPPPWAHSLLPAPQLTPQPNSSSLGLTIGQSILAHSTGDSSEQMDKNYGSIYASKEWDPDLAQLNIPDDSKDHNLLQKFFNDFNRRARGKLIVKSIYHVDLPRADLNHLPVALFKIRKSCLYLIRVLCIPQYRNPKFHKSLASQNPPQKIVNHFSRLIDWLLFINTALLKRLHARGSMINKSDEADSNRRLIDWFFEQTFDPSNSWPVVGTITRQVALAPGNTFGPIQEIIITCLSSPLKLKRELQTAVLLVSHYYQYQFPKMLEALGSGQLANFKSLINDAIASRMKIGNGFNEGNWIEKLGNFPVRSLQSLPEALRPSRNLFTKHYKAKPGIEEEKLREYIKVILSASRKGFPIWELDRVNFNPEDYPVLIANKVCNLTELKHGTVWPRDHKNKSFHKQHVNKRLEYFLDHLNVCFCKLMAFKALKGIQPGDGTEQWFFHWLQNILFPGQDKLPLLGDFDLEKERSVDSFSAQDFNEIQALVLNIIADPNAQKRMFQAALSVLGYWLKNEQGWLYNQLFKNENEYWDNLTELINLELD
ncbi:hypothetical protein VP01_2886g3 [Puccinia sorghi]|uniref:Uncharacterized protein n=1 Tax=Puccinia sorghi TaxID=27349 RepID=A0A0L6V3I7_9BASI|nr:hypothetical protein VP01_2886g3 [Puccinia sorghi]